MFHPLRFIRFRSNCLRRHIAYISMDTVLILDLRSSSLHACRSSFFEMASHTDYSSGFSGERTGSFHLLMVDKPS